MLVEINLLPKKQIKNRAMFAVILLAILVTFGCATFILSEQNKLNAEKQRLATSIATLEADRIKLEQSISQGEESNSVIKLDRTVKWADDYFVETVPLIKHLSNLLPERGFIQSFTYTGGTSVSYIVQFDSTTEVAHYLATLNQSSYLQDSKVNSITSTELQDTAPTITEETIIDPFTGLETLMTTIIPVEETDEVVLPRYLAQFELKLNEEELKKLQKEGE
ncbi:PilN domain-containing protein [Litchfieldia salsa]|uniref:Type IV pilus assembly protein PilN n=1 Tax=Litchfieldia salsa TaxID=930152 RepID=A0A1H0NTT6_9BACI|nr:hypothetical protein [Litchfieldia salsa]SDO96074.1 type IV pilus assembly protein PilN [Litchfieldia salsa]